MRLRLGGDGPTVGTAAQLLLGDFTGDGYADALAFYANVPASGGAPQVYMTVVAAQDPTDLSKGLRAGPTLAASASWRVGSAGVGDFNGDPRADIAVVDASGTQSPGALGAGVRGNEEVRVEGVAVGSGPLRPERPAKARGADERAAFAHGGVVARRGPARGQIHPAFRNFQNSTPSIATIAPSASG